MEMQGLGNAGTRVRDSNDVIPDADLERKPQTQTDGTEKCFNIRLYFCNFCDNTSIHGWKFFGERERYAIEKLWWFIVIVLAIYGSVTLITQNYKKWISTPVIVTFGTTETPIWAIPFPAVTICPATKNKIDLFNITAALSQDTAETAEDTELRQSLLDFFATVCPNDFQGDWRGVKTMGVEEYILFVLGFMYHPSLFTCKWMGKNETCQEIFTPKLTPDGVCYTFNMLKATDLYHNTLDILNLNRNSSEPDVKQWTVDYGYEQGARLDTFPRRTFISSSNGGLFLELCLNKDDLDYACSELQGYKVILHHPAEEPDVDDYIWVPVNQMVTASIKPKMIVTSEEIRAYPTEKRGCLLAGEKTLSRYKNYTQKNCMMECLYNYTVQNCKCVPFYDVDLHLVRENVEIEDVHVCAGGRQKCVEQAKVKFMFEEAKLKIKKTKSPTGYCNCLPSCTSLEFDTETSQIDWNSKNAFTNMEVDNHERECVRLYVYYKDMQFMAAERHELYGTVEFLANCGGLLGLFCGVSFTSLIEILYYFTLRLICNFKMFGRRFWSGVKKD